MIIPIPYFDNRFLIHAENWLGFLNEMEPDFPYWVQLQPDWHNALIGCMRCQFMYPVNKPYLGKIVAGRLTLGLTRPWGSSVVATPESPEEPEQLPGLIKPASRKDGPRRRGSQ